MRFISLVLTFLVSACTQQEVSSATATALNDFLKGSTKPAIIKFYADWCESCKDYAPIYSKVQATQSKSVDFYSLNIDDKKNQALLKQLKISRIPVTYFISKDRRTVTKKLGPLYESELKAKAQGLLL